MMKTRGMMLAAALAVALPAFPADFANLSFDPVAMAEGVPLFMKGFEILQNVAARQAKHARELAARGFAELDASREAVHYKVDLGILGTMEFDDWGELFIDRRFITDAELATVRQLEAYAWKHVIEPLKEAEVIPAALLPGAKPQEGTKPTAPGAKPPVKPTKRVKRAPRIHAGGAGLPIFRGFEDARYQQHDALIAKMTADFNANKAKWCGGNPDQITKIADLTPALVKAHMIEESGGNGPASKAAWAVDPLQVNVPGDWGREKELVGLVKPAKRNEGAAENNVRAAIMYLSRKGFGSSARPAAERPAGFFDGWPTALTRYNGRRDRTATDRYYSEEYSDKIVKRAANPEVFVPIEIKLAGKK